MPQQLRVVRELDAAGAVKIGFPTEPPGTQIYVDVTNGNNGNDGLGWGATRALKTVAQAMTDAAALAERGRVQIFVAPAWITEDVSTPLNTEHPFGQLIAFNPTPYQSYGAAGLAGTSTACLQVRARGWYISGFEFDAAADQECVILGGGANTNAAGVVIEDCLFVGQNQGLSGIDMQNNTTSNALQRIRSCGFYGFHTTGTTGRCITCTVSGIDQPRFTVIEYCWFGDSDNLIDPNGRGFKESIIRYNCLFKRGANYNPTIMLDNTAGNDTQVYGNKFAEPYTTAGGYIAGTNDNWAGNMAEAVSGESANGWTYADPAS